MCRSAIVRILSIVFAILGAIVFLLSVLSIYTTPHNGIFIAESGLLNEGSEETEDAAVIADDRYYKIFWEDAGVFRYQIYNEAGDIIKEDIAYRLEPEITPFESENLVEVAIGVGTGTRLYTYFDIKENKESEVFDNAHFLGGRLIAIVLRREEETVLVLRDIFGIEEYFYEIKRDFSGFAVYSNAVISVTVVDATHIEVRYYKGTAAEEVLELITVPAMPSLITR
jgi:hypothetical protein